MAIKIALVNNNGEVITVLTPGTDEMYENGQVYGEFTAYHILDSEDAGVFISSKYYDFDLQDFANRTSRPSDFHNWNKTEKLWEFDFLKAIDWVRMERGRLLTTSDWTQLIDVNISEQDRLDWQVYRQALRDLPEAISPNIQSLNDIIWPTPPT